MKFHSIRENYSKINTPVTYKQAIINTKITNYKTKPIDIKNKNVSSAKLI